MWGRIPLPENDHPANRRDVLIAAQTQNAPLASHPSSDERTWAALAHASALLNIFSGVGGAHRGPGDLADPEREIRLGGFPCPPITNSSGGRIDRHSAGGRCGVGSGFCC